MINSDSILTTLCDKLSAGGGNMAGSGLSGLQDRDYPLASQTGSKTQICVRGSVRESIRRVWLLQIVYLVRFNEWKINQVDMIRLQWHNFQILIFKYLPSFLKFYLLEYPYFFSLRRKKFNEYNIHTSVIIILFLL